MVLDGGVLYRSSEVLLDESGFRRGRFQIFGC
jgi:hypothetical protein